MPSILKGALGAALFVAATGHGPFALAAAPAIEAGPEPAIAARPGQIAAAKAAAQTYWDRVLTRCDGEAYRYYERSEIVDYKAPLSFTVEMQPLSDEERQAGYQWKAGATLTAAGWRSRGADDNLHTRGYWSAYVGDADESVAVAMYAGKVLFDGAELAQVPEAISCDEATGPAGAGFALEKASQ